MYKFLVFLFAVLFTSVSYAQTGSFYTDGYLPAEEEYVDPIAPGDVLPVIKTEINEHGVNNIKNAEKIYYYEVASAPKGYDGYSIDGYAIRSFGGIITEEIKPALIKVLMGTDGAISSDNADCVIKPRVMFRFVRGVDYTDVLLSSPCQAIVVYYGGKMNVYNLAPIADTVDTFVSELTANTAPFVSPALLDQTLPVGIASTAKEKELIRQAGKKAPIRAWDAGTTDTQPKKPSWGSVGGI